MLLVTLLCNSVCTRDLHRFSHIDLETSLGKVAVCVCVRARIKPVQEVYQGSSHRGGCLQSSGLPVDWGVNSIAQ